MQALLVLVLSNQEELVISADMVKRHVCNIFPKLGVKNRVQAVARARTLGFLEEQA